MINRDEYIAGTNPTNAASYLHFEPLLLNGGGTLTFGAISSRTYTVEFNDTLTGGVWSSLTNIAAQATNHTERIVDPVSTTKRFYRIVTPWREAPAQTFSNMVWIPGGTFTMGSPASEPARTSEEVQHQVTISRGFWMGKYEVTQAEYLAVMGSNPSWFPGDLNRPVERVSWFDCTNYCAMLTTREQAAGRLPSGYAYRLPTEAEWEYACRAGTTTPFHYGSALRSGMVNFWGYCEYPPCGGDLSCCNNPSGLYLERTTSVGSYAPNAWGLHDMHGNVWEWCSDRYGVYPNGSVTDPQGAQTGTFRVFRGGSYGDYAFYCRSANRFHDFPNGWYVNIGFRVVLASTQ
jgi:formylglycine-generating enzyme required for sulfatase activity